MNDTHENTLQLLVKQMTWESEGVLSLVLVDPDGKPLPSWSPGAHIDLALRDSLVRQYSLCGDPADPGYYRVAVLREEAALGGSKFVHEALRPGHQVQVRGPRNHFALLPAKRYIFIAGGIGITPILPMIREVQASGTDWRLYYGGRHRDSMAFTDELAAYDERVTLVPENEQGRLDLHAILPVPEDEALVYCCGPEPLLNAVEERCSGWPEGRLQTERFKAKPRGATSDRPEQPIELVCQRSATSVAVEPGCSLLEALETAGIDVPSSCRDGICGTCETRVLDGVPDHRDSLLSAAEQQAGTTMMVCVSRAKTDRLVLDL
jgi:ferredoxin-NADP reductase